MILLGYLLAVVMGLTLGLIGAGGSILTVPILVYLLGVKPVVATSYSLLVVGCAALAGAIRYWRRRLVNLRAAAIFVMPAMVAVFFTRTSIIPVLADPFWGMPKDNFILLLFAGLMIVAAMFMLRPLAITYTGTPPMTAARMLRLIAGSAGVGVLTGMVGAGGGFLIIPTLIALFGLPVKEAIGTSLTIIAVNSLVGFKGDLLAGIVLDVPLLLSFLCLTLLGMWMGTSLSNRMDGGRLRTLFGYFILAVGLFVLVQQCISLAAG